jgi:phage terminase large subunit-like protein
MLEWSVPEDADIENVCEVKKANPACWITEAALREQREAVAEVAFRRYHCNQWTAKIGAWLPAGAWQACAGETSFEEGERIWVGVDVGGDRADSAVVWVNEKLHIGVETWSGDDAVLEVAAFVGRALPDRRGGLRPVAGRPDGPGMGAARHPRRRLPQSDSRMIPASERLYDAVAHQRLTHPDEPELNEQVHAAIAKHSRRGWRLDKPDRSSEIDAVVALAMAVERQAYH